MSKIKTARARAPSLKESVDVTLRILDEWGLSAQEQTTTFGLNEDIGSNPEYVAHQLKSRGNGVAVTDRCELVIDIKSRLGGLFQGDCAAEKRWLNQKMEALDNRTPRSLMRSGSSGDLRKVAGILQRITG